MKRLFILFLVMIFLSACASTQSTSKNQDTAQSLETVAVDSIDTKIDSLLSLQSSQTIEVCDYTGDYILLFISDPSQMSENFINDQFIPSYCDKFVLIDAAATKIIKEYPVQKFGACSSAAFAFDGIVFSFFSITDDKELDSSIVFIDGQNWTTIYQEDFNLFGTGPIFQHCKDGLLFSYVHYDNAQSGDFGLNKIDLNLQVSPVLQFNLTDTEYISDDFSVSSDYYVYAIGQDSELVFCVVSADNPEETMQIKLSAGKKIHGFSISDETLYVSIAADEMDENETGEHRPYIETFDLRTGQSTNCFFLKNPLYSITANHQSQICGFTSTIFNLFAVDSSLKEVDLGDYFIHGSLYKIFSFDDDFLIVTYVDSQNLPTFWRISPL